MVNSRAKGNRGEREALALLKSWWGGEPWARRSMGQEGDDIVETPSDFPWSVEVKNHSTTKVRHFFSPTKQLQDWWQQTRKQATKKLPLLLTKTERRWYAIHATDGLPETSYLKGRIGTEDEIIIQTIDDFFLHYDGKVLSYGQEDNLLGLQEEEKQITDKRTATE